MHWINPITPLRHLSHKLEILVHGRLWLQVIIALFLGVAVGVLLGPDFQLLPPEHTRALMEWLALPGYLFLRLIKMIVIPLVVASIIRGLGARNDPGSLKSTGLKMLVYVIVTTTLAIIIGLLLGGIIKPGTYVDYSQPASFSPQDSEYESMTAEQVIMDFPQTVVSLIPENPLDSMLNMEMLGIVIFSILIGLALASRSKRKVGVILDFFDGVLDITMTIVKWAMFLVPFAVFGLIAKMASEVGIKTLVGMSVYALTVVSGLLILLLIYYLLILIIKRKNPLIFASRIIDAQILAFSTSSSAAVMPVSIKTAEEKLNVDQPTAEFIVPIGATMNMAGTALYQAIALMFLAQMSGVDLPLSMLILIIVTLVASSIGAPGTPGISVVILGTIASSFGIPVQGMVLILGVDRLLDMFRTSLNVTGDLTACALLSEESLK